MSAAPPSVVPPDTDQQFRLPDPGEGLTEAEIVTWRVAVGDRIAINDIVVEIETAKAIVELPSPFAGTVASLLARPGDVVPVGSPIMTVTADAPTTTPIADAADPEAGAALPVAAAPSTAGAVGTDDPGNRSTGDSTGDGHDGVAVDDGSGAVLVGYGTGHGVPADAASRRRRYQPRGGPAGSAPVPGRPGSRVLAKPPVRRLARDLGIDIDTVPATGAGGSVTREDVLTAAAGSPAQADGGAEPGRLLASPPVVPMPDDVRIPVRGVRRATAEAMVLSAFTAPHVTEWVQVDVTPTMEFVRRMRADKEFVGLRVSPLLVVAKAVCLAARRNPGINATWDEASQEIVLRRRVHLGIAAATSRGLVVPVIRAADEMHMPRLAQELTDIVATAREGRLQPEQMSGGTLTITNVGVFGVDGGTPIMPPGQAAILTMGQIRPMPWVVDGEVVPRDVATLSVSFDHRLVDGELGSSFLTDVAAVLGDPARGLIWA